MEQSKLKIPRTNKRSLKADEVCSILKACFEAKVKILKFHDLHVWFHTMDLNIPSASIPNSYGEALPQAQTIAQEHSPEFLEQEAAALKQEQLDLMMIEDPAQYEHLLLAGELEDAKSGDQGAE